MRPATSLSAERPEWREGKVRPLQGNSPHDRLVSRVVGSPKRVCDDPLHRHLSPALVKIPRRLSMRFFRHRGIYQSDVGS